MTDTKASEATRKLMRSVQETSKAIADTTVAAQERNTKLAQGIIENGIEVIKSQVGVTQSLMQELGQQYQKQQDAFQALAQESMEAYRDFLFAPLTFFQKAMDTAEAATREGMKNFQQMSQQGLEQFQKTTRQAASTAEKAARSSQNTPSKTAQ